MSCVFELNQSLYQLPENATHYLGTLFIPEKDIQDGRDYRVYQEALSCLQYLEKVCDREALFHKETPRIQKKIDDYDIQVLLPEYSYPQCSVPITHADTTGNLLETEIRIADDSNFYIIEARFPLQDHKRLSLKLGPTSLTISGEYDFVKISLHRRYLRAHSSCSPVTTRDDGSYTRPKRSPKNSRNETWTTPKNQSKRVFDSSRKPDVKTHHGKIRILVNKVKKKILQSSVSKCVVCGGI